MATVTAIGKIFNGIKYDFPIEACVKSHLEAADEFHLVVCEDSEDETVEYCRQLAKEEPRLKLLYDKWRISPNENHTNMVRLANKARNKVTTDWFMSVDMDEIIPTKQAQILQKDIDKWTHNVMAIRINFVHLWGDLQNQIVGKLYPHIQRIARSSSYYVSGLDGCGLQGNGKTAHTKAYTIHYGYLREAQVHNEKEIRFQTELYGGNDPSWPDKKLLKAREEKIYDRKSYWALHVGENDKVVPFDGIHHPLALAYYKELK